TTPNHEQLQTTRAYTSNHGANGRSPEVFRATAEPTALTTRSLSAAQGSVHSSAIGTSTSHTVSTSSKPHSSNKRSSEEGVKPHRYGNDSRLFSASTPRATAPNGESSCCRSAA